MTTILQSATVLVNHSEAQLCCCNRELGPHCYKVFKVMTPLLRYLFLACVLCVCSGVVPKDLLENYPTPYTKLNRIMGMILSYNFDHIDPMMLILREYQSMCEGGWDPTIVFFTTIEWSPQIKRLFRQKTYCYRTNSTIPIRVSVHDPSISTALGAQHRRYMQDEMNNFDIFVYHEDDIIFTHSHLVGYLHETKLLQQIMPDDGWLNHCIGFQRYRRLLRGGDIHSTHYGDQDIIEQDLLEEMPNFRPVCIANIPYLKVEGNIHQAMWVLTNTQIQVLQEKCQFLNQSSASREYMSSFSLFNTKGGHCSLIKLLPGSRLTTFTVWHYYQQRHVAWTPVFTADENIRAGAHYTDHKNRNSVDIPSCWNNIIAEGYAEQYLAPTTSPVAAVAADNSSSSTTAAAAAARRRRVLV